MKRIIILISVVILIACDKVKDPYEGIRVVSECDGTISNPSGNDTTILSGSPTYQKVLIEEYTGHQCKNCPKASKRFHDWAEGDYDGRLIILAVHIGSFAEVIPEQGYVTDFRVPAGYDLQEKFQGGNNAPSVTFNRSQVPVFSGGQWPLILDSIDASGYYDSPRFEFGAKSIFNISESKGILEIEVKALADISEENLGLGVFLSEDSIVAQQLDVKGIIPDYIHRNVLRKSITGTFGNSFISGEFPQDTVISQTFCYDIDPSWNAKNCNLIFFISNLDNNQILQAEDMHLIEK